MTKKTQKKLTMEEMVVDISLRSAEAGTTVSKACVRAVLASLEASAKEAIKNGSVVTIPGLVNISAVYKEPRNGRNPKTGEEIIVGDKFAPKFSAVKSLKATVEEMKK